VTRTAQEIGSGNATRPQRQRLLAPSRAAAYDASMPEEPVVSMSEISVSIDGRDVIRKLSLNVRQGDRLCIVGPPGSGKSLLLELMAGRPVPHRGQLSYPAWLQGNPDAAIGVPPRFAVQLVSTNEQRRVVSRYASFHQARWHACFSEPDTVEGLLSPRATFGLREFEVCPAGLEFSDHHERRAALLTELEIEYLLPHRLSTLSNGEWRRLLLARALLARPRLLLLDDPLGGVDPNARKRVVDVLAGASETLTMVYATPRSDELSSLTTRSVSLAEADAPVPREPGSRFRGPLADLSAALPSQSVVSASSNSVSPATALVLRLRNSTVRSGATKLLDSVSLEVYRGQHWLITGPNGAGKSTLLALLLGDHPQSYVVDLEVLGMRAGPGVTLSARQRGIGFMSPELAAHYPPSWSVRDVVLSGLHASIGHFVAASAAEEQLADGWLQLLHLVSKGGRPLASLSEVETRRVFLARALMRSPALLLLDEPTQGLTRDQSGEMLDLLDAVVECLGSTLLIVSHHALERPRCITHHLALDQGRVAHYGRVGQD